MFPGFGSYKGGLNELIALDIEAAAIGGILDASHVSFTSMDKHIQVLPCNSQDLRRKQQYTTPNPEVEDSQGILLRSCDKETSGWKLQHHQAGKSKT